VPPFPPSLRPTSRSLRRWRRNGGFTIFNTNDLLVTRTHWTRAKRVLHPGYVPGDTPEGSCHTLKVKLNRGGLNVRARSGYCNTRSANVLEGKPLEKQRRISRHGLAARFDSWHVAGRPISTPHRRRRELIWRWRFPRIHFNSTKKKESITPNLNVLVLPTVRTEPSGAIQRHR